MNDGVDIASVWGSVLSSLNGEIRERDLQLWIRPLSPAHEQFDSTRFTVRVPHEEFGSFVHQRFGAQIERALADVTGRRVGLAYEVLANDEGANHRVCTMALHENGGAAGRSGGEQASGQLGFEFASGTKARTGANLSHLSGQPAAGLSVQAAGGSGPRPTVSGFAGSGDRAIDPAAVDLAVVGPAVIGPAVVGPKVVPARDDEPLAELHADYSFDNFVIGSSNQFAAAACMATADNPAKTFNPLFIYGGTGLGKTHLLHAIGNRIRQKFPAYRVRYISSEQYINELIQSLRHDRMDEFRYRYRTECDVLLVDDIQFFAGKDRTQYEFFHTFNSLHTSNRQIVVTSDRAPQEVRDLEERLRTRFEWGLIADVQPPEVETRVAILQKKAERDNIQLPEPVAMFLATHIRSNVRVLEGALTRLHAYATLTQSDVTVHLARDVLTDVLHDQGRVITSEQIAKAVGTYYGVKLQDLKGPRRHKVITRPRMVAMYLCRKLTSDSYPEIGRWFGGRDHSTVISAVSKIEALIESDPALHKAIRELRSQLDS